MKKYFLIVFLILFVISSLHTQTSIAIVDRIKAMDKTENYALGTKGSDSYKYENTTLIETSYSTTLQVGTTLFVKETATGIGDGSSWDNAYDGTQLANYLKNTATAGTKIYVAAGTYYPITGTDRTYSFELNKAIELHGGYSTASTGTDLSSYAPLTNITRLSGDIGTTKVATDNTYRVVIYNHEEATLSGFHISDGYGNGTGLNNDGAGIFCSVGNTTGILSDLIIENNTVIAPGSTSGDGCGGGIYLAIGVASQFNNIIVRNNAALSGNTSYNGTGAGGGIFVADNALSCTLINSLIQKNNATRVGGGLYSSVATVLEETTVSDNNAGTSGGGVYAGGALTLNKNIVFEGNIAQSQGGAIWKGTTGSLTTTGATVKINNNKAITGTGGGIHTGINLTGDSWEITNNQAGTTGGGINTTSGISITLDNSRVTDNTANGNGGGIYASGLLTLSGNNTISYNKAGWTGSGYATTGAYHGGGIYAANSFTLKGALVCNGNGATGDGGGIYKSATGIFTATELTSLELNGNGAGLGGTTVSGSGGGMYTAADIDLGNLTTGIISNNTAKPYYSSVSRARGGGGGIYALKTLVLKNAVIKNNSVTGTVLGTGIYVGTGLGFGGGGGIFTTDEAILENVTLTNNNSSVAPNNSSNSANGGGGICAVTTIILRNVTVYKNTSLATGGGILTGSTLTSNNVVVNNNTASTTGGGIHVVTNTVTLNNSKVNDNRAEQEGGGIYSASVQSAPTMALALNSTTVNNNTAGRSGGGIYTKSQLALTGNDTISYNKAGYNATTQTVSGAYTGGGIHVSDYSLVLSDTVICKGNIAGGNGGGIYKTYTNSSSPFTVTNLKLLVVDDNESKAAGGGIYTHSSLDLSKLPQGSSINGNKAGTTGGGIRMDGTSATNDGLVLLTLGNLTISYNTAAREGGGIYASGPLTLSGNNTVSYNKAGWTGTAYSATAYAGGGIYTKSGLTLIDTLICKENGASGNGGGIYKATTTTSTYYSTAFTVTSLKLLQADDNESKAAGGGIYTSDILNLGNLQKVSISGNIAKTTGGGIHANNTLTLIDVAINNNTASSHGGGIYAAAALTLDNMTIFGNKAGYNPVTDTYSGANSGGGIYANNNITLKGNIVLNQNLAAQSGGGIYKNEIGTFTAENLDTLTFDRCEAKGATAGNAGNGGGAIYLKTSLDLSAVKKTTISNCKAVKEGGGIFMVNPSGTTNPITLKLNNATVSGCTAGDDGGGLESYGGSYTIMVIKSSIFTNNTAGRYGGGIGTAGALYLEGKIVLDGNSAISNGGGISQWYYEFVTDNLDTLIVTNNTVIGPTTPDNGGGGIWTQADLDLTPAKQVIIRNNTSFFNGGGICTSFYSTHYRGQRGKLKFGKETIISDNKAGYKSGVFSGAYSGGGVYVADTLYIQAGAQVTNNATNQHGGGIYAAKYASVDGAAITGNTAGQNGGGIYANAALTLDNATFSGNKAGYNPATDIYSGAYSGGGIYANNTLTLLGTLTCENNTASQHGGGIWKYNTTLYACNTDGLTRLELNNNKAGAGTTSAYGGGAYLNSLATVPIDLSNSQSNIKNNMSSGNGGGMYIAGVFALSNATVSENKAGYNISTGTWTTTTIAGGGIYLTQSGILTDVTISDNRSNNGGGIALAFSAITDTLKLKGTVVFERDSAYNGSGSNPGGGAITFVNSQGVISANAADGLSSLLINECRAISATSDGGAISVYPSSGSANLSIILKGSATVPITISNCKASRNGGAISGRTNIDIQGATFKGNIATGAGVGGGAIFRANTTNAKTFISQCTFQENETNVANSGGAIFIYAQSVTLGTTQISNCTFYGNKNTANNNGAAIYINATTPTNAPTTISFCTFYGNPAPADKIYSIYGNTATTFNGNIVQDNIGKQTISTGVKGSYNIVGVAADTTLLGIGNNNKINTDVSLLFDNIVAGIPQLVDNGNIPPTFNIKEGSVAHNFIPNSVFYSWNGNVRGTDQRSLLRPFGCKTDAGAVELQVEKPITITTGVTEACTGDEVLFTGETGFATYTWASLGGTQKEAGVSNRKYFSWATNGQKTVLLTVADEYGCENTIDKLIDILLRPDSGPVYRLPNKP